MNKNQKERHNIITLQRIEDRVKIYKFLQKTKKHNKSSTSKNQELKDKNNTKKRTNQKIKDRCKRCLVACSLAMIFH
jgi:hypothetical protein